MKLIVFVLILLGLIYVWYRQRFLTIIVSEFETGRYLRDGQFFKICKPGRYQVRKLRDQIIKLDLRPQSVTVPAQSIFTLDSIQIKITLITSYRIQDAERFWTQYQSSESQLYLDLQLVLREYIAQINLETLLNPSHKLDQALIEMAAARISELGIELLKIDIKDLMLPTELRNAYAQKLLVQKQAEVKLEQARSEQATLRKLANAARLLDQNPSLLSLRLMHSLEQSKVSHSIHFTNASPALKTDPLSAESAQQAD